MAASAYLSTYSLDLLIVLRNDIWFAFDAAFSWVAIIGCTDRVIASTAKNILSTMVATGRLLFLFLNNALLLLLLLPLRALQLVTDGHSLTGTDELWQVGVQCVLRESG